MYRSTIKGSGELVAVNRTDAPYVPASVERLVKQLVVTHKAVQLYPPASSIPRENAQQAVELLRQAMREIPELRLSVTKAGLLYEVAPIFEGQTAYQSFAQELYNRNLAEVRFHSGVGADDIVRFLGLLMMSPSQLEASGGIEGRLWDLGVDAITVRATATKFIDTGGDTPHDDGEWPPEPRTIDEILAKAYGIRPRDQRLLVRLAEDSVAVAGYIVSTVAAVGIEAAAERLSGLAHTVAQQTQERRSPLYRNLCEALAELDPAMRTRLLVEHLLPAARTDEALASVIRHMDVDEIGSLLATGFSQGEIDAEGLARAIRYLALISLSEREAVLNATGAALRRRSISEERIQEVFEGVTPSKLNVTGAGQGRAEAQEAESILRLVDLAPTATANRFADDPAVVRLQEESRKGITDGDVVRSLVTLVAADSRGAAFDSMVALLEDMAERLVERGEYEVAADAAEMLTTAMHEQALDPARRSRLAEVLSKLAGVEGVRGASAALRVYGEGSSEHEASKRLLMVLGHNAIDPLLEILADEPDMAARKALVDTISEVAQGRIDEMVKRISDPRWYFVRNVVAILGKIRDPKALPALGRTLRHQDARVRRETVRALSTLQDRLAEEMLLAALADQDAQNVQLAARYLGVLNPRGAVEALEQVVRGEGRGNRETGPRVEAIEALGRARSRSSLPLLESIAGKRALLGGGRTKELRAAAESAIAMIEAAGDSGEKVPS